MGIRKNIAIQTLTQTLGRGLGFLFSLIVARKLGAGQFGVFSFTLSLGTLFSILMDLGLDPLIVKWTARQQDALVASVFRLRLAASLGIFALIIIVAALVPDLSFWTLALIGLYFVLQINLQTHVSCFQGIERMEWETGAITLQKTSAILLALGLLWFLPIPQMGALGLALSVAAGLGLARWFSDRLAISALEWPARGQQWFPSRDHLRLIFRESLPLAVVLVAWSVYFKIDVILLKAFVSDAEIGYYSSAYKILEGLTIFPSILLVAIFPALSRRSVQDEPRARGLLGQAFFLLAPAALLIWFVASRWSPLLIEIVYGSAYAPASPLLNILALALLALFPGYLFTKSLLAYDRNALYAGITVAAALLNIGLNLYLIPRLGAAGSAWATVVTESLVTLSCGISVFVILSRKRTDRAAFASP